VNPSIPSASEALPIHFIMQSQSYKNTIDNESLAKEKNVNYVGTIDPSASYNDRSQKYASS
jgi:hypothetical protein